MVDTLLDLYRLAASRNAGFWYSALETLGRNELDVVVTRGDAAAIHIADTAMRYIPDDVAAQVRISLSRADLNPIGTPRADPRFDGMVYFDIVLEDYNIEEDRDSDDPEARERYELFIGEHKHEHDPLTAASLAAENAAIDAAAQWLKEALGRDVAIGNEGHSGSGLVCKFGVNGLIEVKRVIKAIHDQEGSPWIVYSWMTSYVGFCEFGLMRAGKLLHMEDVQEEIEALEEHA
jgi:hypothetical protein